MACCRRTPIGFPPNHDIGETDATVTVVNVEVIKDRFELLNARFEVSDAILQLVASHR